jgi:hypothetical protein
MFGRRGQRTIDFDDYHHHDHALDLQLASAFAVAHREEHQSNGWQSVHATGHGSRTADRGSGQPSWKSPEKLSAVGLVAAQSHISQREASPGTISRRLKVTGRSSC